MNIVMVTNTYSPHVGGVARSIESFAAEYRRRGHRVLVVAPEFPGTPAHETDVFRIPAIQNFNGSDFSVALPVSGLLHDALQDFAPHIVHSHHPYLLGMTALRVARYYNLPLVFTHHTRYEEYTHYVPLDSPKLKRFVIELATRYCNLCDQVFAPSRSIGTLLGQRGVTTPIAVVPTGVRVELFSRGDRAGFRRAMNIDDQAFLVGHVSRLAPEKNQLFLAESVAAFIRDTPSARFLVVGQGPSEADIRAVFARENLADRLSFAGVLTPDRLADAYHAMDVFAFSSKSETQGMVITEAMAAGLPVVALEAPGVEDVVRDRVNGRLLGDGSVVSFAAALAWIRDLAPERLQEMRQAARRTADEFSMQNTAGRALACYERLLSKNLPSRSEEDAAWERVLSLIRTQWEITRELAEAAGVALRSGEPQVVAEGGG
ncbi:MAG TPA: glycosyltransferase family 4 protein [Desulfobulbus sp.]|nr:glycosyltransferase family 4 protein [Desulfobulbus sp.]